MFLWLKGIFNQEEYYHMYFYSDISMIRYLAISGCQRFLIIILIDADL